MDNKESPKTSSAPEKSPQPEVIRILGQEITGLSEEASSATPAEPLPTDVHPLVDLGPLLDETPPEPQPVTPQPSPPAPEPEPEPEPFVPAETLPSKPSKKSHKSLILATIGALAAVLVVAIVAIVITILSKPPTLTPLEIAFNNYANDLISGTPSSEAPKSFPSVDQFYYHQKLGIDQKTDQSYIDRLSDEFEAFYKLLPTDKPIYSSATNYRQLLNFLKLDPSGARYSRDSLFTQYLDGGETAVIDYMRETLGTLSQNNPYAAEFRSVKQNEFAATIDYLLFLDAAGCIDPESKTIYDHCQSSLDRSMQNQPELYYYRDRTGDEPASYFQADLPDDAKTSNTSNDSDDSSDSDSNSEDDSDDSSDSTDSPSTYYTPYTVMNENANRAKYLLKNDYDLLGKNLTTLKNAL